MIKPKGRKMTATEAKRLAIHALNGLAYRVYQDGLADEPDAHQNRIAKAIEFLRKARMEVVPDERT